jgi:hypothetical protein
MTQPPDIRAKLAQLMEATLADEAAHKDWTYRAVRPMPVPATWKPGQAVRGDCSKGVQYLCHWAGGPDPMGEGYGPYGNSQTLWLRLQHLDRPAELKVGDVVTFGYGGADHAAMVLEAGGDPLVWSFGHEGAPNAYRLSLDFRPKQYLRYPVPTYEPTAQDRLRAQTSWFAWVAWRLGEGDWRHYQPADPSVRPNVSRPIPLAWWVRYARFLANRRRGG